MTGKTKVWPVKSRISPDIVRWPAVISSPGLTSSSFFFARNIRVEERKKEIFEQCSNQLDAYV